MVQVLLTGCGGFLGAHCLQHLLENTDWDIAATDSFRHRGLTDRIALVLERNPAWRSRVRVVTHDLTAPFSEQMIQRIGAVDHVIACASESHVPRSIADPVTFIRNNVEIALTTLEYCRQVQPKTVVWVSTDEVAGPGKDHKEWDTILPSSPYASSKASQEAIAFSYWRTFGLPVIVVNCVNLIGQMQDPEKYLPLLIRSVLNGDTVRVHGTPGNIGTRYYMHARCLADAILFITCKLPASLFELHGTVDRLDRYNVTAPDSDCISNLQLGERVAAIIGKPLHYELAGFDRLGHDPSYGINGGKLRSEGWEPPVSFDSALTETVHWYLDNQDWLGSSD